MTTPTPPTEEVPAEHAEWLRLLLEHFPAAIWATDDELRLTFTLGRAFADLHARPDRGKGLRMVEFFGSDEEDHPGAVSAHRAALAGTHSTFELDRSGVTYEAHVEPFIRNGEIRGVIGIALDITDRKKMEAEIRLAEAKYRTLVEAIPAVTYVDAADETSSTIYISPQVEELLGYTPEEWRADSRLWPKLLHPEDRDQVLEESIRTNVLGEPFRAEYRLIARDGRVVWVEDEAVLVRDMANQPSFWQGVMIDITERKHAEQMLLERLERLKRYSQEQEEPNGT